MPEGQYVGSANRKKGAKSWAARYHTFAAFAFCCENLGNPIAFY